MNVRDAAALFAALATAFSHKIKEGEPEVWFRSCFDRVDRQTAEQIVNRIIINDEFWPTPARFNAVKRELLASAESSFLGPSVMPQLPAGSKSEQDKLNAWGLAECRRIWAEAKAREKKLGGHKHGGGPDVPCPVCGGFTPPGWRKRTKR